MKCKFDKAWVGECKADAVDGSSYCSEHKDQKCCVCGEQATKECSYTGQFVCCYPLCDNCEGWEDLDKPSGNWGFMNHAHRKKLT